MWTPLIYNKAIFPLLRKKKEKKKKANSWFDGKKKICLYPWGMRSSDVIQTDRG